MTADRRRPDRQQLLLGGSRRSDPPLTTRDCADWMGVGTDYIVAAIDEGRLRAEVLPGKNRIFRVHLPDFVSYLKSIGWKHRPKLPPEGDP